MASAWAEYQLAEIKRNSANFSVQADQGFAEYRDRLIEWHHRPQRARKIFQNDLERFRIDAASDDIDLIERQRRWKAEQSTQQAPVSTPAAPSPATAPAAAPTAAATASKPTTTAAPAAPTAPVVPPASSRVFAPTTEPKSPREPKANTEVIEATIDDDATTRA